VVHSHGCKNGGGGGQVEREMVVLTSGAITSTVNIVSDYPDG